MIVAVLCPGPSLYPSLAKHDYGWNLKINVNRVQMVEPSDWWAVADTQCCDMIGRKPICHTANLFTVKGTYQARFQWFHKRHIPRSLLFMEDVEQAIPTSFGWPSLTATRAAVLAWYLGATCIELFGCDCDGEADWDGYTNPHQSRCEKRWGHERRVWRVLAEFLRGQDVNVRFHSDSMREFNV